MKKFASIEAEYSLGTFQERNIIYRALPPEIKDDGDREQAHNRKLAGYDELAEIVINISRSFKYQKTSPPRPLTTNRVAEPAEGAQSENEALKNETQGEQFIAEGNEMPQEAALAINSVIKVNWNGGKGKGKIGGKESKNPVKGKRQGKDGKGKDRGKGKGMGKAHIQCHGCGQYGHYVRDCPDKAVKALEEPECGDWGQAYNNSNRVTLVVSEATFSGYQTHVGKTNWNHISIQSNRSDTPVPDVPIPSAECSRVKGKRNEHVKQIAKKCNKVEACSEGCGC